jgi:chaperonin cofactor prefoldin
LAAAKKSLEELEQTEEKTVFHIIDSLLIPRERQIVIKEIKEKTELISNQLESLKNEWKQEFTKLKQLNTISTVDDIFG